MLGSASSHLRLVKQKLQGLRHDGSRRRGVNLNIIYEEFGLSLPTHDCYGEP